MEQTASSGDILKVYTKCVNFAAVKHRNQRRLDTDETPYINHPIGVAYILTDAGITDLEVLQAAILHDTVEDTDTSFEEIESLFGTNVCSIVREVTDDKSLPKQERKRLQIERAAVIDVRCFWVKLPLLWIGNASVFVLLGYGIVNLAVPCRFFGSHRRPTSRDDIVSFPRFAN
uniref:HD domain-containing protein n=1 Tax=Anopheles culicifacies TaxID=139723 RepID=A0A182MVS3_9DIPT